MIFRNARLILPDGIRDELEIVVREGKIAELRKQSRAVEREVVDLGGNYLAPGFVDLHVHGAFGRDTISINLASSSSGALSFARWYDSTAARPSSSTSRPTSS